MCDGVWGSGSTALEDNTSSSHRWLWLFLMTHSSIPSVSSRASRWCHDLWFLSGSPFYYCQERPFHSSDAWVVITAVWAGGYQSVFLPREIVSFTLHRWGNRNGRQLCILLNSVILGNNRAGIQDCKNIKWSPFLQFQELFNMTEGVGGGLKTPFLPTPPQQSFWLIRLAWLEPMKLHCWWTPRVDLMQVVWAHIGKAMHSPTCFTLILNLSGHGV